MYYLSTRDKSVRVSSAQAIARGLSRDGGLFVPEHFPSVDGGELQRLCGLSYAERAAKVLSLFFDDFSHEELLSFCRKAYGDNFDTPAIAPVRAVPGGPALLELWHGPTAAFKDMALQLLPWLMTAALEKIGEKRDVCVLTATSGDTGKAALEGFCGVPGTKIIVYYPVEGVSDIQKLQMTSQKGDNVAVYGVFGNFDDAQNGVKAIFSDRALEERLSGMGYMLSSANSINLGRLIPQVAYYISAYCDLAVSGEIAVGDEINVCVPTGNFGNILAAYYAKRCGLPIKKFICASNRNRALTDFFETGVYDRRREFFQTSSPSMDILISSNLERLLFELSGQDDALVRSLLSSLSEKGVYTVPDRLRDAFSTWFYGGSCDETETARAIKDAYKNHGLLIDTHTAVGWDVCARYHRESGDNTQTLLASTASPYKFCKSVLSALGEKVPDGIFEPVGELLEKTGAPVPRPIRELENAAAVHTSVLEKDAMADSVLLFLSQK